MVEVGGYIPALEPNVNMLEAELDMWQWNFSVEFATVLDWRDLARIRWREMYVLPGLMHTSGGRCVSDSQLWWFDTFVEGCEPREVKEEREDKCIDEEEDIKPTVNKEWLQRPWLDILQAHKGGGVVGGGEGAGLVVQVEEQDWEPTSRGRKIWMPWQMRMLHCCFRPWKTTGRGPTFRVEDQCCCTLGWHQDKEKRHWLPMVFSVMQ